MHRCAMGMKMCPGVICTIPASKNKVNILLFRHDRILVKHGLVKARKYVQLCRLTTDVYKSQEVYAKLLS